MRIAFVASTLGLGGAERVLGNVVTRLPAARFQSRVFLLRDAGVVGRELRGQGVDIVESIERRRHDPIALLRLIRRFREWRPDIVFCLDHHNAMFAGRIAGLAVGATARVVGSHSTGLFGREGSFRWSDRLLMDFTDCVVALSETHARYLREREGVPSGRIRVIENGVDVSHFNGGKSNAVRDELGLGDDSFVVLMLAALRPEKAHEALLDAAAVLGKTARAAHFLIAGDGPRRGALEKMAADLGVGDNVHFLGARNDVARLLHGSDVLVLPSHEVVETLPLAVLEAMAAGVPVIASRVGSLDEVIRDGENGFLIPPADAGALAAAIERIAANRDMAGELAAAAHETVASRYTVERMANGYAALFEDLAAGS